jgi:hypothetical protein
MRKNKTIAFVVAATIAFSNINGAFAQNVTLNIENLTEYSVEYDVDNEMAKPFMKTTNGKVEMINGKTYLELGFNKTGSSAIKEIKFLVNDVEVEFETINENEELSYKFEISNLETDKINVVASLNPFAQVVVNANYNVVLNLDTLKDKDGNKVNLKEEEEVTNNVHNLADGNYNIAYDVDNKTAKPFMNIEDGKIEIINGKMYLVVGFNKTGSSAIKDIKFLVNDVEVEFETINENEELSYKFEISNLATDKINVVASLNPFAQIVVNADYNITLNLDTLKDSNGNKIDLGINSDKEIDEEVKDEVVEDEIIKDEVIEDTVTSGNNQTTTKYENGETYKINNIVVTDSKVGYQAARQSLNTTSYVEVKNNKTYVTLGFGQTDLMKNIRVLVNGKNVSYTTLNKTNDTMDIKFEVASIDSTITIKTYIEAIEQDISFGVKFDKSSSVKISESSMKTLGTKVTNSVIEDLNSEETSQEEQINEEEINDDLDNDYEKRYSIQNEVLSDSKVGKTMARKYLYETSYIDEDKDGQKYLTITLSGTKVMDNFDVLVNEEDVEFEVITHSENVKSFRFKIDDINDDIRFFMFVKPASKNIDFQIKLLEDTLELLEEKEASIETLVEAISTEESSKSKFNMPLILSAVVALFLGIFTFKKLRRNRMEE